LEIGNYLNINVNVVWVYLKVKTRRMLNFARINVKVSLEEIQAPMILKLDVNIVGISLEEFSRILSIGLWGGKNEK
jgi:hypothetical protein